MLYRSTRAWFYTPVHSLNLLLQCLTIANPSMEVGCSFAALLVHGLLNFGHVPDSISKEILLGR